MRWGIYLNPQTPGPDDDGRIIDEVLGHTDLAERLGASHVWLTEHYFTGYNAFSDPMLLAAAITQRNKRLRIGFSVSIAPFAHPIRFVTQCNLLDRLSGGRFTIGVGAGNSPDEYAGWGLDREQRHERMNELMDVAERAWNAPPEGFDYHGEHFNGSVRGRMIPAPVQKPHPLIAYATATPERLRMVGSKGWALLLGPQTPELLAARLHYYVAGMNEADLSEEQRALAWANSAVLRQIYVAAPGEDWRTTIRPAIETYVRKSALANTGIDELPKDDMEARAERLTAGQLFAGQPDEIVERMRPFAELGIDQLMCWFAFGYMADEQVRGSIERFAEHVAPRLAEIALDAELRESIVARAGVETRTRGQVAERTGLRLGGLR
jgi:alkanesulfonate monooxygenase SsuD/methylene tetrahydromethanopterin reductase-like flavin-dependent oxidoreductase (luciferase family)